MSQNTKTKVALIILVTYFCILGIILGLYYFLGARVIEGMYSGKTLEWLSDIIGGQKLYSVFKRKISKKCLLYLNKRYDMKCYVDFSIFISIVICIIVAIIEKSVWMKQLYDSSNFRRIQHVMRGWTWRCPKTLLGQFGEL